MDQEVQQSKQSGEQERNWYAIHTSSGYENAVVKNLKQRIKSLGMEEFIFDVVVPTKKIFKIKNNKRVEEDMKIYPGYVLVDMIVTDESWWVVRNTPRVSGFLGTGVHPVPVSQTEMAAVLETIKDGTEAHSIEYKKGDPIKIIDGPFKNTEGIISETNAVTGLVKVSVSMFGRETEVELDPIQIKSL